MLIVLAACTLCMEQMFVSGPFAHFQYYRDSNCFMSEADVSSFQTEHQ